MVHPGNKEIYIYIFGLESKEEWREDETEKTVDIRFQRSLNAG